MQRGKNEKKERKILQVATSLTVKIVLHFSRISEAFLALFRLISNRCPQLLVTNLNEEPARCPLVFGPPYTQYSSSELLDSEGRERAAISSSLSDIRYSPTGKAVNM